MRFLLPDFLKNTEAKLQPPASVYVRGADPSYLKFLLLSLMARSAASSQEKRHFILIASDPKQLSEWMNAYMGLSEQLKSDSGQLRLAVFPPLTQWGHARFMDMRLQRVQRIHALHCLHQRLEPYLVITTLTAMLQQTLAPEDFKNALMHFQVGENYDQDEIARSLLQRGYLEVDTVEQEGEFARRGAILDVFSCDQELPWRFEFFGDQLESIRNFSIDEQRSVASFKTCTLGPADEIVFKEQERPALAQHIYSALLEMPLAQADRDQINRSFLEGYHFNLLPMFWPLMRSKNEPALRFLSAQDVLVFPNGRAPALEGYLQQLQSFDQEVKEDLKRNNAAVPWQKHFPLKKRDDVESALAFSSIQTSDPEAVSEHVVFSGQLRIEGAPQKGASQAATFDAWTKIITNLFQKGSRVLLLCADEEQERRVKQLFEFRSIPFSVVPQAISRVAIQDDLPRQVVILSRGELDQYVYIQNLGMLILADHLLFASAKRTQKRSASRKLKNLLSSFKELKTNDLVVHVDHGIGRYSGIINMQVGGVAADFLIVEYADGDKVYVPVDRLNLLQKYASGHDENREAALDKLKGQGWQKRKAGVRKALEEMAEELLKNQAARVLAKAHAFSPIGEEYLRFEGEFPYSETEDQAKAISDVTEDMSSVQSMDRLVCGDVGFGKTEVAIRAAYRAVLDGYQVLILVPTTVLSYQHYRTFAARLSHHGVKVAQINRFVRGLEERETLLGLSKGTIDIVIGTHRLLSADVQPKRLGLLIVDEEQRFGVVHKEKLKSLRAGVHVLTLTATPIPRTLHLSMLGLRDISIIATAPQSRLAVQTLVARFDEELIHDAIRREIDRGGQVFFLHNRVDDLVEMRNKIAQLVPGTDVRLAHGQMPEHKLEEVMVAFIEQKFPVLVCTTIIESGIDIPNVNTLIVNRADRFGLAQLYQIRGRVGRSSRQAFAYFLTPAEEVMTDEAKRRLEVLCAFQELGSGFQIASHDLELRGAGNLLGAEQSGKVADVGLELYTEMLDQAIRKVRGQGLETKLDPEIKLRFTAVIPPSYIEAENQRLGLYKNIFTAESVDEISELRLATADRFGTLPEEVHILFDVASIKLLLVSLGASSLAEHSSGALEVKFSASDNARFQKLKAAVLQKPKSFMLPGPDRLFLNCAKAADQSIASQRKVTGTLLEMLTYLQIDNL